MPRSRMLPTPASSTEIKEQDHSSKLSSLQLTFELPPSALNSPHEVSNMALNKSRHNTNTSPVSPSTSSTIAYLQPSETVKSRRRSSAAQQQKEAFALPPPPTRSRRIIQMKPRSQPERTSATTTSSSPAKGTAGAGRNAGGATATGSKTATTNSNKRQQPSATSAAGRKIARKTAHSLIERRRRSKMNEEFGVLKGLIPACTGEMHKLAILQASIEYVRYLQDCITKLQAQNGLDPASTTTAEFRPAQRSSYGEEREWDAGEEEMRQEQEEHEEGGKEEEEGEDEDVEMTDVETTPSRSPTPTPTPARTYKAAVPPTRRPSSDKSTSTSSLSPYSSKSTSTTTQDAHPRHHSFASTTSSSSTTAPSASSHPPPPPSAYDRRTSINTPPQGLLLYPPSALTSQNPSWPQLEIAREASAALLMLGRSNNERSGSGSGGDTGRRANTGPSLSRGLSVRDLLSS